MLKIKYAQCMIMVLLNFIPLLMIGRTSWFWG